ncbi:MAG: hypothetical protein EZS28_025714 [Streblomastix strix]|uniref:Uncharacterized protein n=1 Tax=Streblomastix strix TaxID=222440 RepID=A0A5J4V8D7_9EUKA|nr:MAG: hypothetical protein EZS28_025714 [Streblomastix strix]
MSLVGGTIHVCIKREQPGIAEAMVVRQQKMIVKQKQISSIPKRLTMCIASVVADCGLQLQQAESNAIRNLLIESARMGQEKNGIPPEKVIPHFYRIHLLQDEYSSVPLDAGTFGGRHVINDFLLQPHLKRKPKMLDIKEIFSSNKIDYSKHGTFLYDHIIEIRIIPSFFVTDALRHQVEALTPTNPDGYTKYITQIGKPLMPHSPQTKEEIDEEENDDKDKMNILQNENQIDEEYKNDQKKDDESEDEEEVVLKRSDILTRSKSRNKQASQILKKSMMIIDRDDEQSDREDDEDDSKDLLQTIQDINWNYEIIEKAKEMIEIIYSNIQPQIDQDPQQNNLNFQRLKSNPKG